MRGGLPKHVYGLIGFKHILTEEAGLEQLLRFLRHKILGAPLLTRGLHRKDHRGGRPPLWSLLPCLGEDRSPGRSYPLLGRRRQGLHHLKIRLPMRRRRRRRRRTIGDGGIIWRRRRWRSWSGFHFPSVGGITAEDLVEGAARPDAGGPPHTRAFPHGGEIERIGRLGFWGFFAGRLRVYTVVGEARKRGRGSKSFPSSVVEFVIIIFCPSSGYRIQL